MGDEVLFEKNRRRQLERRFLKDKSNLHLSEFNVQKNYVTKLIDEKKIAFCNSEVSENSSDQKYLHSMVKRLSRKTSTTVYPKADDDAALADKFSEFFEAKIKKINDNISAGENDTSKPIDITMRKSQSTFDDFGFIAPEELRKVIMQSPSKSCTLDPLPTLLLKQCINEPLPSISVIVNKSLSTGYMPKQLKKLSSFQNLRKPTSKI